VTVFDLGLAPYEPVQELQVRLRQAIADRMNLAQPHGSRRAHAPAAAPGHPPGGVVTTAAGVLLLLEHGPVITLGSRGALTDLLDIDAIRERGISVVKSERGGQTTLHAPGQLVCYPIVPIPSRDLGTYVRALEETLIILLGQLDVPAQRRSGRPGVYAGSEKIASVGLRCQRWVASHGTSLNVSVELDLFDLMVSCGEPGLRQTSLEKLTGVQVSMEAIKRLYVDALHHVFGWKLSPIERVPFTAVEQRLGLAVAQV
jgi:lipoyl(octanoyl) transferase